MLSTKVQDAINHQINNELSASYIYLAMSAHCEQENFLGCANGCGCKARKSTATGCGCSTFCWPATARSS